MYTISQAIEEFIKRMPFIEEGLSQDIINLSGLARKLKPYLEKELYKNPTETAIVMALKRLLPKIKMKKGDNNQLKNLRNITVRSDLVEYAFYNSEVLLSLYKKLLNMAEKNKDIFINFTHGISESTLIISNILQEKVETMIPKVLILDKIKNLSSITLKLAPEHIYVPGVQYVLLKALAWENINVIETISAYSEITFILSDQDIDKAFACLKKITN